MWFIITFLFAVLATVGWYYTGRKYRFDFLSLFLWGSALMWLVDHIVAYLSEGEGIEVSLSGTILGVIVVTTALIIWLGVFLYTRKIQSID